MGIVKEKVSLNCSHCNKIHYKLPCQLGRGRGKYCSKECKFLGTRKQIDVICTGCGITFKKFPCETDADTHFCNVSCYNSYRRENAGENTYYMSGGAHEHRIVAEITLGRKLLPDEVVHHVDEDKHNNSSDNLAVFPNQNLHAKHHQFPDQVPVEPYLLKNLCRKNKSI